MPEFWDRPLILCTRNSARSQMAERFYGKCRRPIRRIYARSNPDRIHPMVGPVMEEIGLDVSGQQSKGVEVYLGRLTAHYLIVVCENGERNCPKIFPGPGQRLYWPFDDPAAMEGQRGRADWRRSDGCADQIDTRLRERLRGLKEDEKPQQG